MQPAHPGVDRRDLLASLGAAGLLGSLALAQKPWDNPRPLGNPEPKGLSASDIGWDEPAQGFKLPPLPYAPDALEPHIDRQTMELHHSKHHASYVAGLNRALRELKNIREGQGDATLIKHWSRELSFHANGHFNHCLFWRCMAPPKSGGGGEPTGALAQAIASSFGSFERFATHFKAAANQVEGSGWAWLLHEPLTGRLFVAQVEKQQDLFLNACRPLLGIDVWEHAYYLKYQNRRSDYVKEFMNLANWNFASSMLGS